MIEPSGLKSLEPAVAKVWRIKMAFVASVATLGAAAYDVLNLFDATAWLPPGVATGGAIVMGGLMVWFVPGLRYRFWKFSLTEEELLLQRGILNRVTTIVPLRRVQHLDVSQDIIEKEFDLGKLIVHTAGTRSSEVILPGLLFEEAESLRDRIKRTITDEPV